MAKKNQPAPMRVTIPNGPTFYTNDLVDFDFDPNSAEFTETYQAYRDAKAALDKLLAGYGARAFAENTGHAVPAGYELKAGLSHFGGAKNGKGWLVVDTAKQAKPKADAKRGFAKWA